jgi:hypothetical protein
MDLDGGTGFDRGFLSEAVNPPGCDPAELLVVDGQVEITQIRSKPDTGR